MQTNIGFGITIEFLEGENETSIDLRNDWVRRTTKLGGIKNRHTKNT